MTRYADRLPFVATPGSAGDPHGPTEASRYLYGAAIVLILIFAPDGLSGLPHRLRARIRIRRRPAEDPTSATTAARVKEPTP
jgi:branched-chain amino acid transport system permease protein